MEEIIPDHIEKMTDHSFWVRMQLRFDSLSSLFAMRLETRTEAVGHENAGKKEWMSDAPQWDGHRAWMLLPYVDALDQMKLQEQFDIGHNLVSRIQEGLQKRELSPSFLDEWGQFCAAAGLIEFIYFSKTSIGHSRSAIAGGAAKIQDTEAHRRWFAHYFLKFYTRGQRKAAEQAVLRLVNAIVDDEIDLPSGYEVAWFESFLQLDDPKAQDYAALRPAFNEHSLSVRHMRQLEAVGMDGIPPIDLEIPDPKVQGKNAR